MWVSISLGEKKLNTHLVYRQSPVLFTQLPQSELEGLDPSCRRFRLENGDSIAEKDEVRIYNRFRKFIFSANSTPTVAAEHLIHLTQLIEYFIAPEELITTRLTDFNVPQLPSRYSVRLAHRSLRIPNTRRGGTSSISWGNVSFHYKRKQQGRYPVMATWERPWFKATHSIPLSYPVHQNYVGIDSEKQPYFLSIVSQDSGTKSMPLCRVILFRKQVSSGSDGDNSDGRRKGLAIEATFIVEGHQY